MKFLTDFYLPSLETMSSGVLTQPVQSILFEAGVFWLTVYLLMSQFAAKHLRNMYRQFEFWKLVKTRTGIFMKNGQDDTVLMTILLVHHGSAGAMMMYGYLSGDATWFRHGYLFETGFEIADMIGIFSQKLYPHRPLDGRKDEMGPGMVFHHTPGTLLALPIFLTGLYENEHIQAITISLLVGGAISCAFAQKMYTLKLDTPSELRYQTFLFFGNICFFFYCRWYVYPLHSYLVVKELGTELKGTLLLKMLYGAGVVFSLFNIVITVDVVPKCLRYIKRCFDGETPLEDGKIPSTRDSLVLKAAAAGNYTGRRSSVINIMSSRRRSSMAQLIGMISLEDLEETEFSDTESDDFIAAPSATTKKIQ